MRVRILIALVVLLAVAVVVVVVRQQRAWSPPSASTTSRYTPVLNTYLASTYAHAEGVLGPTHRWYCATKLLGIHPDGSDATAYAWALCEETHFTRLGGSRLEAPITCQWSSTSAASPATYKASATTSQATLPRTPPTSNDCSQQTSPTGSSLTPRRS